MAWNGSDLASSSSSSSAPSARTPRRLPKAPSRPSPRRGLLAGLLVVALGLLALWYFLLRPAPGRVALPRDRAPRSPAQIAEQKPAVVPRPAPAPKKAEKKAEKPSVPAAPALPPGARTNVLGQIVVGESVVHSNAFRSGAEQVMAWIFTTEVGDMPPVMPKVTIRDEQQLLDMFTKPLVASEGDSERTKDAKETVEFAKKELKEYMKEGGEIQDFLSYYREQLVSAYHERMDARKMAMDMYRSGESKEVCDAFVTKVNEKLAAKGIKAVDIPEAFIQKYAQEN